MLSPSAAPLLVDCSSASYSRLLRRVALRSDRTMGFADAGLRTGALPGVLKGVNLSFALLTGVSFGFGVEEPDLCEGWRLYQL